MDDGAVAKRALMSLWDAAGPPSPRLRWTNLRAEKWLKA